MIITTLYIFIDQLYMISNFKYNIVNCFLWEYKVWGNRPEMIDTFVCLNTVLWNVFFYHIKLITNIHLYRTKQCFLWEHKYLILEHFNFLLTNLVYGKSNSDFSCKKHDKYIQKKDIALRTSSVISHFCVGRFPQIQLFT